MATINLLPWRDEYRQEKKREFFSVLVLSVVLAGVIAYVWMSFFEAKIDRQKARNSMLDNEIKTLNQKVAKIAELKKKRAELEAKTEVIQGLQTKRPLIVRYFDELVKVTPDGIYYNKLSLSEGVYAISGIAESNSRISTLMRNLDRSEYFKSPNLSNVVQEKFDLSVEVSIPDNLAKQ